MNLKPIYTAAKVVANDVDDLNLFGRNTHFAWRNPTIDKQASWAAPDARGRTVPDFYSHVMSPPPSPSQAASRVKRKNNIMYSDITRLGVGAAIGGLSGAMSAGLTDRSLFSGTVGGAVMGGAFGYASNRHLINSTFKSLRLANISHKNARFATQMGYNGGTAMMGIMAGGFLASKRAPSNSLNKKRGYRF